MGSTLVTVLVDGVRECYGRLHCHFRPLHSLDRAHVCRRFLVGWPWDTVSRPHSRTAFPIDPTLAAHVLAGVGCGLAVLDWLAGHPFDVVAKLLM